MGLNCSTPERDTLLRRLWPDLAVSAQAIFARLRDLPGRPIGHVNTVYSMALRLGLGPRRAPAASPRLPAVLRARSHTGIAGRKGSSLAVASGGAVLPARNDDRAEAEAMFGQGYHARHAAAELHRDVGEVSCWYFDWKRRQSSAGSAAA